MCILYTFETGPVTVTDMFVTEAKNNPGMRCNASLCPRKKAWKSSNGSEGGGVNNKKKYVPIECGWQ